MNVPKFFAAKRTLHQKFHHQKHHTMWSSLLLHDLQQIECRQNVVLDKDLRTTYSLYLDELIDTDQEDKLFVHNYYHAMRTISGADGGFVHGMKDYFGVDSEFGRVPSDFFFVQQVHEALRSEFLARAQVWSAKERVSCLNELELAKAMMTDIIREYE